MEIFHRGVVNHRFNPTLRRDFTVYDNGTHLLWELTQGKETLVDYSDFEDLITLQWRAQKDYDRSSEGTYYALSGGGGGDIPVLAMHRVLAGNPYGIQIDHRNMDGLDNRRENLRLATKVQQMFNQHRAGGGMNSSARYSCEYRGVTKRSDNGRFRVRCQGADMKQNNIGHFSTGEDAAKAWDDFMYEEFRNDHPLEGLISNGIIGGRP